MEGSSRGHRKGEEIHISNCGSPHFPALRPSFCSCFPALPSSSEPSFFPQIPPRPYASSQVKAPATALPSPLSTDLPLHPGSKPHAPLEAHHNRHPLSRGTAILSQGEFMEKASLQPKNISQRLPKFPLPPTPHSPPASP